MNALNLRDSALLIQNGKSQIKCRKCSAKDIPHIFKSHYLERTEEWLYKVECAHCCSYIKFVNEHQFESGKYQ